MICGENWELLVIRLLVETTKKMIKSYNIGYNIKVRKTDFGYVYDFDFKYGSFCLYCYNDDNESVFLSNLRVSWCYRKRGLGTYLLRLAVNYFGPLLKRKKLYLLVQKDSWMSEWYRKFGFHFFEGDDCNEWLEIDVPNQPSFNLFENCSINIDNLKTEFEKHEQFCFF